MDSQLLRKNTILLAWIMIGSSIFSCSARADYNIIIGFLVLFLRAHSNSDKFKLFSKATIHIIVLSLIFDCIWIFEFTGYWTHGEETSELWKSLSFIHNLVYYLGICEFLIKFPIVLFLYRQFRFIGGNLKELLNFNFKPEKIEI